MSAGLIFGCVLLNYFVPEKALSHLIYIVIGALVLNWAMISLTHLKFKKYIQQKNITTSYPALFSPFSNWLCLAFVGMVLYIMWQKGFSESVIMIPIWILLMFVLYIALGLKTPKQTTD